MRVKETIPAAGQKKTVSITGVSLIVEQCSIYQSADDVPTFNFIGRDENISNLPIYPRSRYTNNGCEFNQIELIGTAESAGDEVSLLSLEDFLTTDININVGATKKAIAGQTFAKTSTDAAQGLTELELERNGVLPSSIYISARTNDINWGFVDGGSSPDQNDNWHVLLTDAEPIEIQGIDFILKFQFASQAAGTAGNLIVSTEY
jgi:hypothetical protein